MIRTTLWTGFALLALATGCGNETVTDTQSRTFPIVAAPQVFGTTFNGDIKVTGSTDGKVHARVVKTASGFSHRDAEDFLDEIDVSLVADGSEIDVTATGQHNSRLGFQGGAQIQLQVPADATLHLNTSNGDITSSGATGDVDATTSNGAVTLSDNAGNIHAQTSNGAITLKPSDAALVWAHTSNGSIDFAGTLASGVNDFETDDGSINLALPSSSQFSLDATTSNGSISCDFAIATSSHHTDSGELHGSVGANPDALVTAATSNGSISVTEM